jgi:hypothetical protein
MTKPTTTKVKSNGVIVRLTTAEAHIPQKDMEKLWQSNEVDIGEIKPDTARNAFRRAVRQFIDDLNRRFAKKGKKYMFDNVGTTANGEQLYEMNKGTIDKTTGVNDADYSDGEVAKIYLSGDKVIAAVDNEGVRESIQEYYDYQRSVYRADQWRHYLRETVKNLTGLVQIDGGLFWVPITDIDGMEIESNVNVSMITNERALAGIQALCRAFDSYQVHRTTGDSLSYRHSRLMVLSIPAESAEDTEKEVVDALVKKAENIAADLWQEAQMLEDRATKNNTAVDKRTETKFLHKKLEMLKQVNQVDATIGGTLKRGERAIKMVERAQEKVAGINAEVEARIATQELEDKN